MNENEMKVGRIWIKRINFLNLFDLLNKLSKVREFYFPFIYLSNCH